MLSILIPTFDRDITCLVKDLHQQASERFMNFEIIVIEDNSKQFLNENQTISKLSNCKYLVLNKNIGRSAARNRLAEEAKHEHLLFMDCDAEVCSPHFIEKYESFCQEECIVIGGTAYDTSNKNPAYSLRLKYGREREARKANERTKNNFSTFNFLISKSIFNNLKFDESIKGYGHEDMIFGHQLNLLGHEFIQIDNPLIHQGLDNNLTFIRKTEEATQNLLSLHKSNKYPFLLNDSKLIKSYIRLEKYHLVGFFAQLFNVSQNILKQALCRQSPSLIVYDLYKLMYLSKVSLRKK